MDIKKVIFDLCSSYGVSGSEEPAVELAKKYLEEYADILTVEETTEEEETESEEGEESLEDTLSLEEEATEENAVMEESTENSTVFDLGDGEKMVIYHGQNVRFEDEDGNPFMPYYAYDPRLVKVEDTYYIIWCQDFYGAAIGMAKTTDFKKFVRLENPFIPFNRNAVLFPRKINGNYVMLSRPSDSGHTPFGDIFLSESPDLVYWGKHRHVMGRSSEWWESVKIGGGAAPIETSEGWLLFYHGVSGTCNGLVYSIGGAILDLDNPSIVKYRCETFLLTPEEWYEERGFVPNVCFPCATIHDPESGKIAIYYGCADSYVGLAFCKFDEIVDYIKEHSVVRQEDTEIGKR